MECTSYTTYRLLDIEEVISNLGMEEEEKADVVEKYCVIDFNFLIGFDPVIVADYDALYSGELAWPLSGYHSISSPYGMRIHPRTGVRKMHYGIDIPAPIGTIITAPADAKVLSVRWSDAVGWTITLDHGEDENGKRITTNFQHNMNVKVRAGQIIQAGQALCEIGDAANQGYSSTGPHLHFEVLVDGVNQDPAGFFSKK